MKLSFCPWVESQTRNQHFRVGGGTVAPDMVGAGGGGGEATAPGGIGLVYGPTPGGVFSDFGEAVKPPNSGTSADDAFQVCSRTPIWRPICPGGNPGANGWFL